MNIHEIARRSGITIGKLRGLEKLGVLTVDAESGDMDRLRVYCRRRAPIPLPLLLMLLDSPKLVDDLGSHGQQQHADACIAELGDIGKGAAPARVAAAVPDARRGVPVAVKALADWLCATLPQSGSVGYHWIAVRLMRGAPAVMRDDIAAGLNTALSHVRALPGFDEWFFREDGKIRYQRPINFDL